MIISHSSKILALSSLFCIEACAISTNNSNAFDMVTVAEINKNPKKYYNKGVKIRGFLESTGGDLILFSFGDRGLENTIYINDSSKNRALASVDDTPDQTCINNFVELFGVVGVHPVRSFIGIKYIEKISVYTDKSFNGRARTCYKAVLGSK